MMWKLTWKKEEPQKKLKNRMYDIVCIGLTVMVFLFSAMVLYDMQKAEGVGLFLSWKAEADSVVWWDRAALAVGMTAMLFVLMLPCMVYRKYRPDAFFRFLCAYLAFTPTVSTAGLLHLVVGTDKIEFRTGFLEGALRETFHQAVSEMIPSLALIVPFLILLSAAVENLSQQGTKEEAEKSKRSYWRLLMCIFLLLTAVLFPLLEEQAVFWCIYLLLTRCFELWETLWDQAERSSCLLWIPFIGCLFRGIYIMAELMSKYHL